MNWLIELLQRADWGMFDAERQQLQSWAHYSVFTEAVLHLRREVLFVSHLHGEKHIERVLLNGAIITLTHGCTAKEAALLFDACSYHDIGRIDDSEDTAHGARSAKKLPALVQWEDDDLKVLQSMIAAHSRLDSEMDMVIHQWKTRQPELARRLAVMLKDSDGLDRVRLQDLDPSYLRLQSSKQQVEFAEWLFRMSMG